MKTKITVFIMPILFALILCGAVSAVDTTNNTTNTTGLADTPKPTLQGDNNHSGQSNYTGPQTNNNIWIYNITGSIKTSSPVIGADGTIYIGSQSGKFYAINPNGTLKWTYTVGSIESSAAIGADGTIYVGSGDKNLYAFYSNGTLKWAYTTNGTILRSSPTIGADGTIYIGSSDFNLYAITPDGKLKWTYSTGANILCSAAIGADGTIYIGSNDYVLYALIDNGINNVTKKWSYNTTNATISSIAIGVNGTIYAGTSKGLYALIDNGIDNYTIKWVILAHIQGYPAIGKDGTIYVASNLISPKSNIHIITDNGINDYSVKSLQYSTITSASPIIGADGTLYIGTDNGAIIAINPDGTQKWSYSVKLHKIWSTAAIGADGTLYIGIDYANFSKSYLYAFNDLPIANFTANTTNGNTSQPIQFTDTSTRYPASWAWDFNNDGIIDSTEQNPTYRYNKSGTYTVKLTVTNAAGSAEETKTGYITITDTTAPIASADLPGGKYNTTQTVKLNATDNEDSNPKIYYTLDGSTPTTSSNLYSVPITIAKTAVLKFIAVDESGNVSPVYSKTYSIQSNVYVKVTSSKTNPKVGDKVTYTFKLGNKGPGVAKDVVFTYVIPEGLEFADAKVDQGEWSYNETTRTLTWTMSDVAVGDPYLWLNLRVLSAGSFNIHPTVSVSGSPLEENIGSLLVKAVSKSSTGTVTVNAAAITIPMQDTGMPLTGITMALLLVGSGLALARKK